MRNVGAIRRLSLCACVVGAATLATASAGAAATRVPCSVDGPRGLIAAIDAANRAGEGTLDLAKGCTYTLTAADNATDGGNGLPVLTGHITINGKRGTTIARSAAPDTAEFRILEVAKHATVSLTKLTLTGGKLTNDAGQGGAIANEGTIDSLSDVTVRGNSAPLGGGVFNNGKISVLSRDTISGNRAGNGGGVANLGTIDNFIADTVSENAAGIGGGVTNGGAIFYLRGSTISRNRLDGNGAGGGIANSFGRLNMIDDTVSGNRATAGPQASGGGIDNSGKLTLTHSVVKGNVARGVGGGLRNEEQADKQFNVTVEATTITGNTVTSAGGPATGGGIFNAGEMSVIASVVRANHARTQTGRAVAAGIYNSDKLSLLRVFIGRNVARDPGGDAEGGGLYVDEGSKKTRVEASAITGNAAIGAHPHGGGILFAGGHPLQLIRTVVARNRPDNCYPLGQVRGCVTSGRGASDN